MEEKERYEVRRLNYSLNVKLTDNYEPDWRYIIFDDVNDKELAKLETVCDLLNQQDKQIKELEEEIKKAKISNYLEDYFLVEKENQQLKRQIEESKHRYKKAYQDGFLQKQFDKDMEIIELKQQLKDNTKQVCEKIREELNNIIEVGDYYDVEKEQETNLYKQSDIENILKQTEKYK